jgi:hypothetical protein
MIVELAEPLAPSWAIIDTGLLVVGDVIGVGRTDNEYTFIFKPRPNMKCEYRTVDEPCAKCKTAGRSCGAIDKVFGPKHQSEDTSSPADAIEAYERDRRACREALMGHLIITNGGKCSRD